MSGHMQHVRDRYGVPAYRGGAHPIPGHRRRRDRRCTKRLSACAVRRGRDREIAPDVGGRIPVAYLAAVLVTVVFLAGCGRGEPEPAALSPDEVAVQVVETWFGWHPQVDGDRNEAARRAAPLLTDDLAAAVKGAPWMNPGWQWYEWAARGAAADVQVRASAEPLPASDDSRAYRAYGVRVVMTGPGGPVGVWETTAHVVLERVDAEWRVSDVTLL